ncbi:MAG: cyclase family protein, partial [Dehalococcoidales bacterium]
ANMLVLGGWILGERLAQEILRVWLTTPFAGGRHERRLKQIRDIETRSYLHRRRLYDVSLTIHAGMPVWPGNPPVSVDVVRSIEQGDSSNISLLHIGSHTATHVDAPHHFIADAPGIDSAQPEVLMGPARLFQLPDEHHIDRRVLAGLELSGVTRLLLGSRNSALLKKKQIELDYAFISEDAASYLVDIGIKLLGVDYLSLEEYQKEGRPAHHILLGAGVIIVEGLDLAGVPPGDYELICLPLKLKGGDGAPARVFLREV